MGPYHIGEMSSHTGLAQRVTIFVAIMDSSSILSYQIGIETSLWYSATLIIKLVVAAIFVRHPNHLSSTIPLASAIAVSVAISGLVNGMTWSVASQAFGLSAQLAVTGFLIGRGQLRPYLLATCLIASAAAGIHAAACASGIMPSVYGRYPYLGESSANLGGEINAMASICAAMTMRRKYFYTTATILLVSTLYLQSRSAVLVICFLLIARVIIDENGRVLKFRPLIMASYVAIGFIGLAAATIFFEQVSSVANDVLRLTDAQRGTGTGFVGRSDRWLVGQRLFNQSPLVGVGWGGIEELGLRSPHNIFWSVAAQLGLLGVVSIFGVLFAGLWKARNQPAGIFVILLSAIPLLFFNDRSLNLNIYPFVYFIAIVCIPTTQLRIS